MVREFDESVDGAADVVSCDAAGVVSAVPVVDVCVEVFEAESREACPPARPEAPLPEVDDFAAGEVVEEDAGEVASAAAELPPVDVEAAVCDAALWAPSAVDVDDVAPAEEEVASFFVEAVVPPVPAEPPEAPVPAAWEVEESPVSAWAAPAPLSMAAPTPTLNAPAVSQADTGNTRPVPPRTVGAVVRRVSLRCRPAMGEFPSPSRRAIPRDARSANQIHT